MQKKWLVLAGVAVILAFGSCQWEMPRAIELRAKPQLDLPINSENVNLSKKLFDRIKDVMETSDEITVEEIDHTVNGKPVQAFLINYAFQSLGDEQSLNFLDQLNQFGPQLPAGINVDIFNGSFPGNAEVIDLSGLDEFLNGFDFTDIKSSLHLSGPTALFNDLNLELRAKYAGNTGNDLVHNGALSSNGIPIDLETILNDRPSDLYFEYAISTPDLADLWLVANNNTYEPIKMAIQIEFPLALKARTPGGATISLSDMISKDDGPKEPKDLLSRSAGSDSSFFEYIKSLAMQLELSGNVFTGGEIYLDDIVGSVGRRIELPLIGTGLGVSIEGDDLEYINNTIPWDPDIGIYFAPGKEIIIPPNLRVIRLKFEAVVQAQFDLPGSGK